MSTAVAPAVGVPFANDLSSVPDFHAFLKAHKLTRRPRVLMTGGRNFQQADVVAAALAEHLPKGAVLITGAARGADQLAETAALALGHPVASFPAPWDRLGNAAGQLRNQVMLACGPKLVLAFHGNILASRGTRGCRQHALALGLPVVLIDESGASVRHQFERPLISQGQLWKGLGKAPSFDERLIDTTSGRILRPDPKLVPAADAAPATDSSE